jgi:hypothetical protein
MMARWLPQLVEFVSGFDKRRGDLAGGVGFEVGTAGVDCDDPTSHEQCLKSVDLPGKGRTFPSGQ